MEKEKKFTKPEIEIINFTNEDIITGSSPWWDDEYEEGGISGGQVPNP